MLELSSDDDLFTFKHGGEEYALPAVTIDDVEPLSDLIGLPHAEMSKGVRDYIVNICKDDHPDTADLLSRIGLKNFFLIFRSWSGLGLGESEPSDGS